MPTPRAIVLDTFPTSSTGLLLPPHGKTPTVSEQCHQWILDCLNANNPVYVPAIAYYETLREWERLNAAGKIQRLRQFCFSEPKRFLPLETGDLEKAAQLWARARNAGQPTASPDALDVDVVLAAQALSLGLRETDFVIATTNVGHLAQFVPAADWQSIVPGS